MNLADLDVSRLEIVTLVGSNEVRYDARSGREECHQRQRQDQTNGSMGLL